MARRITTEVRPSEWDWVGHFERRDWETQEVALESYFQCANKEARVYRKGVYCDRLGVEWQAYNVYPYGPKWDNVHVRVRDLAS